MYGTNGADAAVPMVSDTAAAGNPLTGGAFNLTRARKIALSTGSTESLIRRSANVWIKWNRPLFDAGLAVVNRHQHDPVYYRSASGDEATGFAGFSNYNIGGGGDYALANGGGIDHHSPNYWHLNSACVGDYFYSYSNNGDGDSSYQAGIALGTGWPVTQPCSSNEGLGIVFYAAVR